MSWPERVALVHDRLDQDGGAERVLWSLHRIFPQAPIFTSMWNQRVVPRFQGCDVRTTWMQRLPGINHSPRAYAALYPLAFAKLDLRAFDLVISLSSAFAKGIRTRPDGMHICYCHSPSNFLWRSSSYFPVAAMRMLALPVLAWLAAWERWAARQPDVYIATGHTVADRIRRFYGRQADSIAPPIDAGWFVPHEDGDFYLVVGRLVEQKRIDLAIDACGALNLPLFIVGEGRQAARLRRVAGVNVRFLGRISDHELRSLYARARAVLMPGEEDFGLVPLEAQAAGTPVIAYDAGGARETVVDGITGIRFHPQTAGALSVAIQRAAATTWDRSRMRRQAAEYGEDRFKTELMALIGRRRPVDDAARLTGVDVAWR